jgi:carboxyl-terminal processing protease
VQTVKGLYRDALGHWQYFADPNHGIAYVRVTNFAAETNERLKSIIQSLQEENLQGLILDLRNNSGGYLSAAVEMVDQFVSQGAIVSTRPRNSSQGIYDNASIEGTLDGKLPLVILVNSISASASEIVSGSLKDHQRALIVGTRTYGKGNVQQIQGLKPFDAELKITIAYYYLPNNRRVHRDPKDKTNEDYGVEPDVKMELAGKQIETWNKTLREAGILHRMNPDSTKTWKTFKPEQILEADPQMKMAVICLRAQLIAQSMGLSPIGELVGPVKPRVENSAEIHPTQ